MAQAAMRYARSHRLPVPSFFALTIARFFVLTLLPIAIAYDVAHYLSFVLMAGQYLIALCSDPFGFGWDLASSAISRASRSSTHG